MASPLEDLDELTLRCRNEKARLYIGEAVASYRAGAFRASIVACWIAVCFDIIEKLRELALAGDANAERHVHEIEAMRRSGDVTRALKLERELLDIAKNEHELISPLEFVDLERLQADRNRCAHPSLTGDEQAYRPSAELARLHIHSSVTHLLQHPPAQGKYALERLRNDVESEYFPTSREAARVALVSGPLKRPRESLVRNFVLVLVKALLNDKPDFKRQKRLAAALSATAELHPGMFAATLRERLSPLCRAVEDESLSDILTFFEGVQDVWQYVEEDVRQRIQNFVSELPSIDYTFLLFLLEYPPLQAQARQRVASMNFDEITFLGLMVNLPIEITDRLITLYFESPSFDVANARGKEMMSCLGDFKAEHVRRILGSAGERNQVRGSYQFKHLISDLRNREIIPNDEFQELLMGKGLEEFALA